MSKNRLLLSVALVVMVSLAACKPYSPSTSPLSTPDSPLPSSTPSPSPTWTPTAEPSSTPTETPAPTPTETPMPTPVPLYMDGVWECWDRGQSVPCSYDTSLSLKQMTFVSDTEAWAVGANGYIARWDGYTWTRVESPTDKDLNDLFFLSSDNGWAVGDGGVILHWDGSAWSVVREERPLNQYIGAPSWNAIDFSSPDYGWVVGNVGTEGGSTANAMYWDGTTWKSPSTPPIFCDDCFLWDGRVFGPQDVWIVGGNTGGFVLHWDGSTWHEVPNPFDSLHYGKCWLYTISALSRDDMWVSGIVWQGVWDGVVKDKGIAIRWDGAEWRDMQLPGTAWLNTILMLSDDDGWVGSDELFHWNGQGWERATSPAVDRIVDVESSPGGEIWALTQHGAFLYLRSKEGRDE